MKNFITVALVAVFIIALYSCGKNTVRFGDVTWQYTGGKKCESILKLRGKTIFGPHNMSLWGQYPYVIGDYLLPESRIAYFVLNVKTGDMFYFSQFNQIRRKYKINFDYRDFVTFQDLKGQWCQYGKLNSLMNEFAIPRE